ncbi:glycoside hydrolase family 3 N-terminal domain-containing protein [Flexithrix dorotheae]|uniref:glycoside hydrolase family 3 N-terminal domain-containing protein n=1 Tax=Flexithrix dorotheae TaxID=70993 RepID=UPI00037CFB83|nr:glycoside hydrolase family 3 N-terminal domain-containing protein [Flexithrix dorotheae]
MFKKIYNWTFLFFLWIPIALVAQKKNNPSYKNPKLPVEERVENLLSQMTLEEKIAQISCIWQQKDDLILDEKGFFDPIKTSKSLPYGIGQIARPGEGLNPVNLKNRSPRQMADFTNTIQKHFVENTRLGIPVIFHAECLHGHVAKDGTSFPQPIGMASSWDIELVEKVFSTTAEEARSRGIHQALAPVVDVARDPRWGRFEETFGEDPFLVSRMGVAAVKGFQGNNENEIDKKHVMSTLKHLVGNGLPEGGNNTAPAHIPERELREVFLSPFRAAVKEANVMSVMASYNEIDGVPSHGNPFLLKKILRNEWGFKGLVVSDYSGISDLYKLHFVEEDSISAGIRAIQSGIDVELPDQHSFPALLDVFKNGALSVDILDSAVYRVLKSKFVLGLFDDPYVNPDLTERVVGSDKNGKLALEAAQKSIVLLKNQNNILPVNATDFNTISVIGPNADKVLLGGYSDSPPYFVTLKQGIENRIGNLVQVVYSEGCRITKPGNWYLDQVELPREEEDQKLMDHALMIASRSDLIIMSMGGNELTSREAWSENHLGDRASLDLIGRQEELFMELVQMGKKVIVVLNNGRPLNIKKIKDHAHAILECWYLGQESGNAIADVIFGNVNPSGKLPCTFPSSVGALPAYYNHKPSARRGYLFDDTTPIYPFGFGLSFTSFRYGDPVLSSNYIRIGENATITFDLTNNGTLKGDEIVQLYIRDQVSSVTRPVLELKGFQKIPLKPGQMKQVSFEITPELLSFYNEEMNFTLEPGQFDIFVGPSSIELKKVVLTVVK